MPEALPANLDANGYDSDFSVVLSFNGINILVTSDYQFDTDTFLEQQKDVTGMLVKSFDAHDDVNGVLHYTSGGQTGIEYDSEKKRLTLKGPAESFGEGIAIAHTAHYISECFRAAERGAMIVHSAAVSSPNGEGAYVFFGEKGAGKTTLALRLCHELGYALIGNDQIYLGIEGSDLVTHGGNHFFNVRETAVRADNYIAGILPELPSDDTKPAWNNKVRIEPESLGISVDEGPTAVKGLFHIRIDHTEQRLRLGLWQGLQRNLILHERLGRHITGQATPFLDDRGTYLGSLPPVELEKAVKTRDELVHAIIKAGIIEIFTPDSKQAVAYLQGNE